MALRIAAIADTHYHAGDLASCGKRRTAIADILLLRAVRRLNRCVRPDLTVLLGDLIDDPSSAQAEAELQRLKGIVDLLKSPVIVIPGNHDGGIGRFYSVFPRPADLMDMGGVRFVIFLDPEEPGYNARRTDADLRRMDCARAGHAGPIVPSSTSRSFRRARARAPTGSPTPGTFGRRSSGTASRSLSAGTTTRG